MNITAIWNVGASYGKQYLQQKQDKAVKDAAEQQRQRWMNALYADATRAWMDIGQEGRGILNGLTAVLTLAGMAKVYDTKDDDHPDIRVIRGAISAAEQCGRAGSVIQTEHAAAFSAATSRAVEIVRNCSWQAIVHASTYLQEQLGAVRKGDCILELN